MKKFKSLSEEWKVSDKDILRTMIDIGENTNTIDVWSLSCSEITKEERDKIANLIINAPKLLETIEDIIRLIDSDVRIEIPVDQYGLFEKADELIKTLN